MASNPLGTPPPQAASAKKPAKSPATLVLRIVLLVVLALLAVALIFDRIARSNSNKTHEAVKVLTDGSNTRKEVLDKVGDTKPQFEDKGHYAIDTFRWRSGLLFKSYSVIILYEKVELADISQQEDKNWNVRKIYLNKEVPQEDIPKQPSVIGPKN